MQKEKSKEIVKPKKKEEAMWLGAQRLMSTPTKGSKEEKERNQILLVARVINVSPFGINILGSLPYINKLGLSQKAKSYDRDAKFTYEWPKIAMDDSEKAICKCTITDKKGTVLADGILGECSPTTIKMSTLKGYQNHMAQTRARNRAILEAFGVRIHEEMMENIQRLAEKKQISEEQKESLAFQAGKAISTSSEEVQGDGRKEEPVVIEAECHECGNPMTKQEAEYSKKVLKKQLCRTCQANLKSNAGGQTI